MDKTVSELWNQLFNEDIMISEYWDDQPDITPEQRGVALIRLRMGDDPFWSEWAEWLMDYSVYLAFDKRAIPALEAVSNDESETEGARSWARWLLEKYPSRLAGDRQEYQEKFGGKSRFG